MGIDVFSVVLLLMEHNTRLFTVSGVRVQKLSSNPFVINLSFCLSSVILSITDCCLNLFISLGFVKG